MVHVAVLQTKHYVPAPAQTFLRIRATAEHVEIRYTLHFLMKFKFNDCSVSIGYLLFQWCMWLLCRSNLMFWLLRRSFDRFK